MKPQPIPIPDSADNELARMFKRVQRTAEDVRIVNVLAGIRNDVTEGFPAELKSFAEKCKQDFKTHYEAGCSLQEAYRKSVAAKSEELRNFKKMVLLSDPKIVRELFTNTRITFAIIASLLPNMAKRVLRQDGVIPALVKDQKGKVNEPLLREITEILYSQDYVYAHINLMRQLCV